MILLIDIPVIHRGFLDFLSKNKKRIDKIGIFSPEIIEKYSEFKRDIASLSFTESKKVLNSLGFLDVFEVTDEDLKKYVSKDRGVRYAGKKESLILVDDEVSRAIFKKYFSKNDAGSGNSIIWSKVFLRWDKDKILSDNSQDYKVSEVKFDREMMERARLIADRSSDWWRQVGAILVKDKKVLLESYNQGLPSDYTPYQVGAIRDFMNPGEKPDLANYIHGEQKIISEAAKNGIKLKGSSLYVTHFPCAICSKLIAASGIKNIYFLEGSSNADGEVVLKSSGVIIRKVKEKK